MNELSSLEESREANQGALDDGFGDEGWETIQVTSQNKNKIAPNYWLAMIHHSLTIQATVGLAVAVKMCFGDGR